MHSRPTALRCWCTCLTVADSAVTFILHCDGCQWWWRYPLWCQYSVTVMAVLVMVATRVMSILHRDHCLIVTTCVMSILHHNDWSSLPVSCQYSVMITNRHYLCHVMVHRDHCLNVTTCAMSMLHRDHCLNVTTCNVNAPSWSLSDRHYLCHVSGPSWSLSDRHT